MVTDLILTETVEFQISLLLASSLIAFFVARTLKQPVVIGQILIGLTFGPSLLNIITYTDFVSNLAAMGAIFLLFVVGLQTKFKEIVNTKAFTVALFGVILPWAGGFFLAQYFGFDFIPALFIGTALTATSIAITAQALKELGKLDSDAAKTIIGAAVIDDILSLMALGITTQFAVGNLSFEGIVWTIITAILFLVIGVAVGVKVLARQLEKLNKWEERHNTPEMTFIAAVAIAFVYSLAAEAIGLSAIVGAFLAGVSLESVKIKSYRQGAEFLEIIFASIFFVSLGVLINLNNSIPIYFLLALTVVAISTKVLAGFLGAKLFNSSNLESLVIGFGIAPRGEIALIIALLGLNSGVISAEVYGVIVLMALLTTIITPVAIKSLYARVQPKAARA